MNFNWSVSTVSRTREKSGEFIYCSLDSERPLVSSLPLKRKTQEDFSKVPPFLTECIVMDSLPTRSSSSITFWVWPLTSSWTRDFKPASIKKVSKPNPSIRLEFSSTKDTSRSARISSMLINFLSELHQRRRSTLLPSLPLKLKRPAEPAERKTKERSLLKNDLI